jgi:hypothetical protein
MFLNESPCAEKIAFRPLGLDIGAGIKVLAAVMFAMVESLLPKLSFQEGPPNCKCHQKREKES